MLKISRFQYLFKPTITLREKNSTTNVVQLSGTSWQKVEILGNPKAAWPQLGHFVHLIIHHPLQSKFKMNSI